MADRTTGPPVDPPDADSTNSGHATENPGSDMADPSHSVPPGGGHPDHGSMSGNLGQRKSRAGPGSAVGQGAGGPGGSQSPQQVTRQLGSDGDHGSRSGNLGQRKSKAKPGSAAGQGAGGPGDSQSPQQVTRQPGSDRDPRGRSSDTGQIETESWGTKDAGGPGGNQSSLQNTGQPANEEGALNDPGKLSSSTIPGKPVVYFKSGQNSWCTSDCPLTPMQWKHLFNEKQELDKLCLKSEAKCDGDGNVITFTSARPQGDFLHWAHNIIEKLKKLPSVICKTELVVGCQQLKAFECLWNEEQGAKKHLFTCFCEESPQSKVTILAGDEEVLKVAEDEANAILDRIKESSIEVPLPYFDNNCLQHFIQPDKFPSIAVWHEKKDVKLHEIKICGLQSECDKALGEISQTLRELKMEEVKMPEARTWISRIENHESLKAFMMKNQLDVLPFFGGKRLFLMGPINEVERAQVLLKEFLCTAMYSLSTEIWQLLMQSVGAEDHGEMKYFIQHYHLVASHDPSTEQLTLVGFLEDHQQLLQNIIKICLQKPPPGVLDRLQDKSAIVHVSANMKGDNLEIVGPVENVQKAYRLIKEVQKKAQQRAPEEKLCHRKEISKDRLVTLLLMNAVQKEVKAYLNLPSRDLADVTWTIDGTSRHLQVHCKSKQRRDKAEREINNLFVEEENIVTDLDEAAADRLRDKWPDLVKELHKYDNCCIASFDPAKKWVLLATLKDRFDQTSKTLTALMQRYQKDHAVKTHKLQRAQYKFLMKENNEQVTAVQSKVEGNGGTFDIQPGDDDNCLQITMTGPSTVVSDAVRKLCQLQNDIHLVETPDAAVSCLTSTEEGRKLVSRLEEIYKCYIDFSGPPVEKHGNLSDYAEVVLTGGSKVSLQREPLKTERVDLVALPVPLEMENKTKSMKAPEEWFKVLSELKARFPRECEKLRKGNEKVLLVPPPRELPCRKAALMAVPCQWYGGGKGEKDFVRSAVRELMGMMMKEQLPSVAFESPRWLPEKAAEKQILVGLSEFFEKEAGKAASPTGIKAVKLFTRRQTDSTDPSELLENAFAGRSNSALRKIVIAAADKKQAQEAAHELSKFLTPAPEERESSIDGEGLGEEMQTYHTMNVSTRFPNFRKKVCSNKESILVEAQGIMRKLVGCSISTNEGQLILHFPTENKKELALDVCCQFDYLIVAAESGATTFQNTYDEILVNAAKKFFPEMLRKVRVTQKETGKVVLIPGLLREDHDLISGLQQVEVQVKDHETEKANTIHNAFLKDANIHVEYFPSKNVVVAVVRKYDQMQTVISRIKVHLGQMKTALRGHRKFTAQTEKSDLDAEEAVEDAVQEAVEEGTEGDKKITLPGGLVVFLCVTDITKQKVDAIVNAANGHLHHGGGVARAIADAAGPDLIQECRDYIDLNGPISVSKLCLTGPGRLPCNRVIHAVGPRWGDDTPEICRKQLYATVLNCCREADEWDLNEIAMPPISSGIYGMPKDQCTEMYCKALLDFDQQPNKKLKRVHFVDINDDMPLALLKALRKKIGQGQQRTRPSEADVDLSQGCVICTEKDLDQPVKLNGCNHVFCKDCIEKWFQTKPTCPSCNKVCGIITGTMPSGTMNVYHERYLHLAGFENCGRIVIDYSFLDGVQKAEHPNPGQRYRGTRRTAYLPDNAEGNKVLRLLQEAWNRKLTFTIGRSTTTGRDNVVTWNDIHHKTSTEPGHPFGYPDPEYLTRVQEELAARGVTEESIRLAQSGNPQDFSQFYTPLRPRRSTPM